MATIANTPAEIGRRLDDLLEPVSQGKMDFAEFVDKVADLATLLNKPPRDHTAENLTDMIRQHADVVRGHDHVHPERDACGGVGGCALMRVENDEAEALVDRLIVAARRGPERSLMVVEGVSS